MAELFYYILKRIILSILVILGIIIVSYILVYIAPGNPAYTWVGKPTGPKAAEAIKLAEKDLGLDKPFYIQLYNFIKRFFSFSWGISIRFKQPVSVITMRSLAATLELVVLAYIIAMPLGIFGGVYAALHRDSIIDKIIYGIASILASSPRFWIAAITILLMQMLGINIFGRISASYAISINIYTGSYIIDSLLNGRIDAFVDAILRTIPPAILSSFYPFALTARIVRHSLSEELHKEYVRQLLSYGLKGGHVVKRYALRGVIPVLAQIQGISFAYSIIDVAAIENVFGREGIGVTLSKAILANDYPLIVGLLTIVSILFVIAITIADIIHIIIDPRVRI
ncbi:MAG: ABC transporter permease [Ignisphaera sp.]